MGRKPSTVFAMLTVIIFAVFFHSRSCAEEGSWQVTVIPDSFSQVDMLEVRDSHSHRLLLRVEPEKLETNLTYQSVLRVNGSGRNVLLTRWGYGAHSETVRIYDPAKKVGKLLCMFRTSFPISFSLKSSKNVMSVSETPAEPGDNPKVTDYDFDEKFLTDKCPLGSVR